VGAELTLRARLPKLRNLPTSKQRQRLGLSETVRDAVGDGSTTATDRRNHCCSRSHSRRVAARLRADWEGSSRRVGETGGHEARWACRARWDAHCRWSRSCSHSQLRKGRQRQYWRNAGIGFHPSHESVSEGEWHLEDDRASHRQAVFFEPGRRP